MKLPLPFLLFNDARGLELPRFNTFRLGGAWSKRLKKGDKVLIAYKHSVLACAKVEFATAGVAYEVLNEHAHLSHIELALAELCYAKNEVYPILDAAERRAASMLRTYGPAKFNPDSIITVVQLRLVQSAR